MKVPKAIHECVNHLQGKKGVDDAWALCNYMHQNQTGFFGSEPFTDADLPALVQQFKDATPPAATLKPPLVAVKVAPGHEEDEALLRRSDLPAAGWVKNVYRDGNVLLADFREVPQEFEDLIARGAYKKISPEIYTDFEDQGRSYGLVLRKVCLLGGEIPQVKSLKDIPKVANGKVNGVEIFAVGNHRGRDWTVQDLDEIAANFKRLSAEPHAGYAESRFTSVFVFHEAKAMTTKKRLTPAELKARVEKFSEPQKKTWQAFAADPHPMAPPPAPPPSPVNRAEMLDLLAQLGYDTSLITDATPDAVLAEMVRLCQQQPGATMSDTPKPPETPPLVPAPAVVTPPVAGNPAAPPMPTGQPQTVTLKYSEFQAEIEKAVQAALKPIQEGLGAAKQDVAKFQETEKKKSIDSRLDLFVQQGKVLPAEIDDAVDDRTKKKVEGLRSQLYRANGVQKFADGETELDKQFALLERRPQLVKFSERVRSGAPGSATSANGTDPDAAQVEAHYEQFSEVFEKFGMTKAQRLEAFAAWKRSNAKAPVEDYLRTA